MPIYPADLFYSVDEIPQRSGRPYSADGHREYNRKWRVRAKLKGLGPVTVCTAPTIPRPGAFYIAATDGVYEYDTSCLLTDLKADEQPNSDDWGDYVVSAVYSTKLPTGGSASLPGSPANPATRDQPTLRWPTIRWTFETVEIPRYQDLDGLAITNSAGQPLGGGSAMRQYACKVLTITRNEASFDSDKAAKYSNSLNSKPFLGYQRWAVKCRPPTAEARFDFGQQYWEVTYQLVFHPKDVYRLSDVGGLSIHPRTAANRSGDFYKYANTWQLLIVDAGTRQYTGPLDRGAMFMDTNNTQQIFQTGKPVHDPVLLNGKGKQLLSDDDPNMLPFYCPFRMYPEYDFTDLIDRGFA